MFPTSSLSWVTPSVTPMLANTRLVTYPPVPSPPPMHTPRPSARTPRSVPPTLLSYTPLLSHDPPASSTFSPAEATPRCYQVPQEAKVQMRNHVLAIPERSSSLAGCPSFWKAHPHVSLGRTFQEKSWEEACPPSLSWSELGCSGWAWPVPSPGWTCSNDVVTVTIRYPWPQRGR